MIKPCGYCSKLFQAYETGNSQHCSAECRRLAAIPAVGSTWGRWTVLDNEVGRVGARLCFVKAQCQCGTVGTPHPSGLKNGTSRSCGCLKRELRRANSNRRTHGMTNTPEWRTYHSAKKRCTNPNDTRYADYGGRGIEFRFVSFEQFWSELGPKPSPKHSINRIDNDGHYAPGNVSWASDEEQRKNKRPRRWAKRPSSPALNT